MSPVASDGSDLPRGLRSLLTSNPTAIIAVDPDGLIAFVNGAAEYLFRHRSSLLVGQPVEVLIPSLASGRRSGSRRSSFSHPLPRRMAAGLDVHGRRRDGSEFPVTFTTVNLTPTDLGDGRYWAVVAVTDVSARVSAERQLAELSRSYLTLAQLNHAIVRAPDADALFASTCQIAVEQGGYLGAWIAVSSPDGRVTAVAQAGALGVYINQLDITLDLDDPRSGGPVGTSLREGRPCFSTDFLRDPATAPWQESARRYGVAACGSFPLRTQGRVVATLTLYTDRPTAFDDGVGDLLTQVAEDVSFALDGFGGAKALVAEVTARRDLLRRLVLAEEKERGRIACDLHDDSVQVLAAVSLRLSVLSKRVGSSPEAADVASMVQTISDTVALATDSLRNLLFELEPPLLAQSFVDALRTTAERVFEDETTTWSVTCVEEVDLPDIERGQALRIAKEALINARKHAHASHVDIVLHRRDGGVEVAVTDDGDGLPADGDVEHLPQRRGHRGLETMRDRASATGGWCRLERSGARGATLRFFVPHAGRD